MIEASGVAQGLAPYTHSSMYSKMQSGIILIDSPHDSCWAHFSALTVLLLSEKLASLKLEVEEISLTSASQRHKLGVILEAVNQNLQVEEKQAKWSVESM